MNLLEHAKNELKIAGYVPLDQEQEDGPNKWIQENILELLEVFSKQGHSGFSANYCIDTFKKLASFEPLSPIVCNENEWCNIDEDLFQNTRLSSVFKEGVNGKPYFIDAIIWVTQNNETYTGAAITKAGKKIGSAQTIKLPFYPKRFYVDVIEKEIAKDDWEFYIKDESQLDDVFNYYEEIKIEIMEE